MLCYISTSARGISDSCYWGIFGNEFVFGCIHTSFWSQHSTDQKHILLGSLIHLFALFFFITLFSTRFCLSSTFLFIFYSLKKISINIFIETLRIIFVLGQILSRSYSSIKRDVRLLREMLKYLTFFSCSNQLCTSDQA